VRFPGDRLGSISQFLRPLRRKRGSNGAKRHRIPHFWEFDRKESLSCRFQIERADGSKRSIVFRSKEKTIKEKPERKEWEEAVKSSL